MNNYNKGIKKAENLVNKAKQERNKKGYRENLGYDSIYKLEDYISVLDLSYLETCKLKEYFIRLCDSI